jgi:Fic family protein
MNPPYKITGRILRLISEVSHKIGEINASFLVKQSPELRKRNRIRTIQASLAVEGNTLSIDQITAVIENKRVIGPAKDILEVTNAIEVYDQLKKLKPFSERSFLAAHKTLMKGLIKNAGQYRRSGVGIVKGSQLAHVAPPSGNVSFLMKDLFEYVKNNEAPLLIKSCVFHYEMEFIHPFSDGNGRMGRLWQTLLLMQEFPIIEFLPFETLINKNQKEYYRALSTSDKQGESTIFIDFMLETVNESLEELLKERSGPISGQDRINLFLSNCKTEFTRKDYMNYFKTISTATASRDLQFAVESGLIKKFGDKNKTTYEIK